MSVLRNIKEHSAKFVDGKVNWQKHRVSSGTRGVLRQERLNVKHYFVA
jgi:hypothetical protein